MRAGGGVTARLRQGGTDWSRVDRLQTRGFFCGRGGFFRLRPPGGQEGRRRRPCYPLFFPPPPTPPPSSGRHPTPPSVRRTSSTAPLASRSTSSSTSSLSLPTPPPTSVLARPKTVVCHRFTRSAGSQPPSTRPRRRSSPRFLRPFPQEKKSSPQVEPHQQHARSLDLPRPPDQLVNRSRRPGTARSSYLCSCPAPQRVSALSPAQKILTPLSHPTHPPLPNVPLHGLWSDSASSNVVPGRRRTGRATWVSPCAGPHRPSPPLLARQHLARHQRPRVWDTPRPLLSLLAKIFCATDIQNEPAPRTQHSTCGPASAP